jgi:hypothetical protein
VGCETRYHFRKRRWAKSGEPAAQLKHQAWWVVHNCVAHPLLGVAPTKPALWFHDWTARYLNRYREMRRSHTPQIGSYPKWLWHNVVGHMAIGAAPCTWTFAFHDRTSKDMNVPFWV